MIKTNARSSSTGRRFTIAFIVALLVQAGLVRSDGWFTHSGNSQHSGQSTVAAQPLEVIHWAKPVDLAAPGGSILIHYGTPIATSGNTIVVPVKTTSGGSMKIDAVRGSDGSLVWSKTTDYVMPAHNWLPSYSPCLTPSNRVYYAGAGGTIYYRDNADLAGAQPEGQLAFYGIANYLANPSAYNSTVFINTPITSDAAGNIYFGFRIAGTPPLGLKNGIARIGANGVGSWISAFDASNGDVNINTVPHQAAPALSSDGATLYVVVRGSSSTSLSYLVAMNSTTLAFQSRVSLRDPRNNGANAARVTDDSSATPMVGPDGDVYYGILGNPSNGSRGWLLHFNSDLSQRKTPGAFGWDNTPTVVPASCVPSYQGSSSYLLFSKYNNYAGLDGGDGVNKIAILDPNATQPESHASSSGLPVMKEILTIAGPTPDDEYTATYPNAVREWCLNTGAVDPFTCSIMANSEDGKLYRWDLTTNTLSQVVTLSPGIGEAYTPTIIGPDGTAYAINWAILNAVGARPAVSVNNTSVTEGHSGSTNATFTISLSSSSTESVAVNYATADGSAMTSDNDYGSTSGTVNFSPGQTSKTITVAVNGDSKFEVDETFAVNLSSPVNATIGDGQGVGTIVNDDALTTLVIPDSAGYAGGKAPLSAILTTTANGQPVASQSVAFKVNGANAGMGTTDSNGVARVDYTIPVGTALGSMQIAGDFVGNNGLSSSSGEGLLYVRKKPSLTATSVTGAIDSTVTLKATLKFGTLVLTNRTIHFLIDGVDVGSGVTGSTGVATLSHVITEAVGTHQIKAVFDGDSEYAPFTSAAATLMVNLIKTTLTVATITASPGQTVNLKATLKAGSTLLSGKTVTFAIDGTSVGSATTDVNGVALLSHVANEPLGSHTITAQYAGDSVKYAASTGTGTLKVLAPTKIVPDVIKAPAGSSVPYGAKLMRADTLAPLEGKTLSFYNGTTLIGSAVTDATGRATIMVTAPGVGVKQSITVKFAADAQYKSSSASGSVTGT